MCKQGPTNKAGVMTWGATGVSQIDTHQGVYSTWKLIVRRHVCLCLKAQTRVNSQISISQHYQLSLRLKNNCCREGGHGIVARTMPCPPSAVWTVPVESIAPTVRMPRCYYIVQMSTESALQHTYIACYKFRTILAIYLQARE